jgi:hypothetical protein
MKKILFGSIVLLGLFPFCANSTVVLNTGVLTGDHTNDSVTFNLTGLSAHTDIKLGFDLFIMDSWDSNKQSTANPDIFGYKIDGIIHSWTFGNFTGAGQSLSSETNIDSSWISGNFNSVTSWGNIDRSFINYADGFTFAHTGNTLNLEFFGQNLQAISDESWRVSNILLTTENNSTIPEPTSLALLGLGLAGFGFSRKKKRA